MTHVDAAADARQAERDKLNEIIAAAEAVHGSITEEEIDQKRDTLMRARRRQGTAIAGHTG